MSKGKTFIIGSLVGGLIGSVAALLFAPKAGKELRTDIAQQCNAVADKTKDLALNVSQKTTDIAKEVGTTATDWYGRTKEAVAQAACEVKSWKERTTGAHAEVAATQEKDLEESN
ncbi:YtxH domain-containing protein [Paenibacillus swuensis]|uniref:YtxH domain-containing protein n=1 Tax=Paenibacillus swuensis TaxID=1178515 RepID=UPI00083994AE|nr:YtxH domain-containing protein [Paenibacillus swuensis]